MVHGFVHGSELDSGSLGAGGVVHGSELRQWFMGRAWGGGVHGSGARQWCMGGMHGSELDVVHGFVHGSELDSGAWVCAWQ